ncbi:histidine kinase [Marinicauda salina]|uniref:histidine kinase n=1 Tax=Marinicauda salina TaxID=2135793 RepID=A0A2U2BXT9_9PROT|nr:ATP-binding protein [Marinicauda salina]PWE18826.1 histidine kinase [Marinicauda salina]
MAELRRSDPGGRENRSRPRARDVVAVAAVGVFMLVFLTVSGELAFAPFVGAALALAALALIYYLGALGVAGPGPRPAAASTVRPVDSETAEAMLDRLSLPVLLIGPAGRIERANPAARAFLGLGVERGLLSTVLRQPRVLEAVNAALRGERGATVEYSTRAPLESHVRAIVEPIRLPTPEQTPLRAMLVLADETASKRAERMRADFLANASHELRTPLASLSGFIDTLSGPARDDPEASERFLGIMREQTERMRRLINDLLSLSRVEMNEHVPPSGECDLAALAGDVVRTLSPMAEPRGLSIAVEAPDEPVRIGGDRDQIYEVIENLVENALKYSRDGGRVRIVVRTDRSRDSAEQPAERIAADSARLTLAAPAIDPAARYAVVRVYDEGAGIERRYLPRLSERFFRVSGQKSGPRSGTGLGLAIVKHIVSRHRGGFAVESAPGSGSVFTVFFPTVEADSAARTEDDADAVTKP